MRHRGEAREKRIAQFEKIAQESSSPPPESSTWDEKYQRFELPTWDEQYQRFELLLRHDFHGEPRSAGWRRPRLVTRRGSHCTSLRHMHVLHHMR